MHKLVRLLCSLFVTMVIVLIIFWFISQTISFVRKIDGLPIGQYLWFVDIYQSHLFIVDAMGNKVDITDRRKLHQLDPTTPRYVALVDPDNERVVEEFTSNQLFAVAITAEREKRADSWLAKEYDYWVLDSKTNIAYARKPVRWEEWSANERYSGVYVIDIKNQKIERFLEISPLFSIALHPNGEKLYVMTMPKEAQIETYEIRVYSTKDLSLLKTITSIGGVYIWDTEFTKDGSRLFCCVRARGLLVVNTTKDELEKWEQQEPSGIPMDFGIRGRNFESIALSSDEKELYVALRYGEERGAVAAIDIAKKKLVRILELSPTGCSSVVVVGNKLFAACLDGVYVIDIPTWRQQQ